MKNSSDASTVLTLQVPDLERSQEFYTRLPGARLIHHRPRRFALLRIGGIPIGLFPHGSELYRELFTARRAESLRFPFHTTKGEPTHLHERELVLHDPDGNVLEFVSPGAA